MAILKNTGNEIADIKNVLLNLTKLCVSLQSIAHIQNMALIEMDGPEGLIASADDQIQASRRQIEALLDRLDEIV